MRATNQALKPGGRFVFYVIYVSAGLNDAQLARIANRDGNEHVGAEAGYDVLMSDAGFEHVEAEDVTAQYLDTLQHWRRVRVRDKDDFVELIGEQDYDDRMRRMDSDIANVRDGLLQRQLVSGVKP